MPYTPARTPDTQQRLILLYTLSKLAPCYDSQLLQFVTDLELMNYFDMMFALIDLCRDGNAVREQQQEKNLYSLTPAGRQTLELLIAHLPESVRALIDENAPAACSRIREEQVFASSVRRAGDQDYRLSLGVMDHGTEVMQLTLSLPDASAAEALRAGWPSAAQEIYAFVIRTLSEGLS